MGEYAFVQFEPGTPILHAPPVPRIPENIDDRARVFGPPPAPPEWRNPNVGVGGWELGLTGRIVLWTICGLFGGSVMTALFLALLT